MTARCWDGWVARFEARGSTCFAPAWPGRYGSIEMLRRIAHDGPLVRLRLSEIVDEYYKLLFRIEDPVVFVGHAIGGLIAQLLLQRGLACGAVAICPAPPYGVRARWPALAPWSRASRPMNLSRRRFARVFAAQHSLPRRIELYESQVVPESRLVALDALSPAARIDFARGHAPLLLIAAGRDRVVAPALVRATRCRYAAAVAPSVTDFTHYPDRSHGILSEPGWEQVADDVLAWVESRTADAAA